MLEANVAEILEECARHGARAGYPEDVPSLPPIPAARYCDLRLYELELEHIWKKSWLIAGHISELRQAGAYKLFQHFGQNIIISRGMDDQVRAFHNICTHRGAPLLKEPQGTARRFLCPYHSWNFSTSGALTAVPEDRNFACLDRSRRGLLPVRCEIWRGFIFINLDSGAESLADYLRPVADRLKDFPFEEMEVKRTLRIELDANWKAVFDNFIESYHLNTVHPAISRWIDSRTFVATPLRKGHAYYRVVRKNQNQIIAQEGLSPPGDYSLYRKVVVNTPIFPNLSGGLDTTSFVWESFWPDGPFKTVAEIPLLGWKEANDDAYWDAVMAENVRLAGEDIEVLPGLQKALMSGHLPNVMFGYQELGVYWYHEEIDRRIGREKVPPELRVQPVLEPYAQD